MTPREYKNIWQDAIDTSTYSMCKCGERKRTVRRYVYNIGGLRVTSPVRVCDTCEPRGEGADDLD